MKNTIRLLSVALLSLLACASLAEAGECGHDAPKLVAPSDHSTVVASPIEMRWTAVPGAEKYRVWVIEDGLDLDVVGETSRTNMSVRLSPGEYGWFVEALFGECAPARSTVFVFDMKRAEHCSALAPTPLSPAEGDVVTSPVTLSWTAVPGAIAYEVSAALEDGEPVFVAESRGTSLTAHLGDGKVRWMVEAEFSGCTETESVETSFVIPAQPGCDHDAPFPIAPAFGAVDVPSRVEFLWTPVDGARGYRVLLLTDGNDDVQTLGTTTATRLSASVPSGPVAWSVVAEFESCPPAASPVAPFVAAAPGNCAAPAAPELSVQPRSLSRDSYAVIWSAESNVSAYEVEESTTEDFSSVTTRIVNDIRADFSNDVTQAARYFYRVRSLSACGFGASAYSKAAAVEVSPRTSVAIDDVESAALYGQQDAVVQTMHVPGLERSMSFTASSDKPWLTISPASGTIPPDGIDLQVVARPAGLPSGTSQARIGITYEPKRRRRSASNDGGSSTSIGFSLDLVTPVSPVDASTPLPGSLFLPAIAAPNGFQSDVRIANTSAQVVQYLLNFRNRSTTIQIEAGQTTALNEIAKNFYGVAAGEVAGVLEIRPLTAKTAAGTFASSRTYAAGLLGTYGDYVPAFPFSKFIGKGSSVLSLQNITQSSLHRTRFALIEGAGERGAAIVSLFRADGTKLFDRLIELQPGQQLQVDDLLDGQTVDNGRIEIAVSSGFGKVTAYASVVDTMTGDPTLVLPIDVSRISSGRVMLPGIAHVDGAVSWRSSIRLFNSGSDDVEVTLMYIPRGLSAGPTITRTMRAGDLLQMDDVLRTYFDVADSTGAVLITTPKPAGLVATASTFHRADGGGVYGQFIPGITPDEGVGVGDRALQILQIEESDRFRTNLGIVELTGKSATVEISAHVPDSKVSVHSELTLLPNEFRQIGSVLRALGFPPTYNARITLKVIAGDGRVSGHASLIDNATHDPTYVPAQ